MTHSLFRPLSLLPLLSLACGGGDTTLVSSPSVEVFANEGDPSVESSPSDSREDEEPAPAAASDVEGFLVAHSDYSTYGVSLVRVDGSVENQHLISSGSTNAGLSAPFTDLSLPSALPDSSELVLINRTPAAFLTFVDRNTGRVRAQLDVGTGFSANPQDYVPLSATKAYVTRHASNLDSGREPLDEGDDVLIVDPRAGELLGRIALDEALDGEPEGLLPRAARAIDIGGRVRVLALGFDAFFEELTDARVVSLDPERDELSSVLVLDGLMNCGSLAASPSGERLAVGCVGPYGTDPADGFPAAGIALLEVGEELQELTRFSASELGVESISSLSFASEDRLAFTSQGRYDDSFTAQATPDAAHVLDLETGRVSEGPLHQTVALPYSLGEIRCAWSRGACLLTDAETGTGVVHHFEIDAEGRLGEPRVVPLDLGLGLPPRSVGLY